MTQTIHPLYGEYITDAGIARAIPLPAGVYDGLLPSIAGAGGSAGWTASLDTIDGHSLWRTQGDTTNGRILIEETGPIQVHIAGPSANPRIDLIVGIHKWVQGPTDPTTFEPTGSLTDAQKATYAVVQGTPATTPTEPTVLDPWDVGGNRAVVLAKVTVPVSGAPTIERYQTTDLRLAYMRAVVGEVVTARNEFGSLKERIDAIGTAQLIEAASFKGSIGITGGGNLQPVVMTEVKKYGDAVVVRDNTTLGLAKPGLYEVICVCNSVYGRGGMLNATQIVLGYNGAETSADFINDTFADDEDQTAYAMLYVDPSWTDPYISIHHDSFLGGTMRGSVKYLGTPSAIGTLGITTGNIAISDTATPTWPNFTLISLVATNAVGGVTWSVVPGGGLQDGTTDPKASIVGGALRIDWTANPGALPKTWSVKLQATDSATPARTVQKTITITLSAYSVQSLVITATDKIFTLTGAGPFTPSFTATATGGTPTYTWALVAGADTTLPGASIDNSTGVLTSSLTFAQMNTGPYKVRLRCTDSAGSPVVVEKVINITTAASSGGGGGGGGGVGGPFLQL